MEHPRFSIIVPVYNRRDEVADLLASLEGQTCRDFEAIFVEDGSPEPCGDLVEAMAGRANARYLYRPNEGRSPARNAGIDISRGRWLVFVDSDVILPPDYVATLSRELDRRPLDCFGGPDAAHESFSDVQKAINVAMTSFLTTGGIRGGKKSLERFTPRSFNMGMSRAVYNAVGGFREMFSEDIDLSTRIRRAGFTIGLMPEAAVWHKRRVDMAKFMRQVYVFGMSRITLKLLYPDSMKPVHMLPALAVIAAVVLAVLAVADTPWWLLPIGLWLAAIFVSALVRTRSPKVAALAVPASMIQIGGYGTGFIKAYVSKIMLRRGRSIEEEKSIRRGK